MLNPKTLIVYGPTAVGKTSLALSVASGLGGEIISADSRQIYKGMNIGTGKDVGNSKFHLDHMENGYRVGFYRVGQVRIWLLDIVSPDRAFSSYRWAKLAGRVLNKIQDRNRLPVVTGGSAFYIKSLLDGLDYGVGPDWELRKKLEKLSLKEIQKKAKKAAPRRFSKMNRSDRMNPRRLIRLIEIDKKNTQKRLSGIRGNENILGIFITAPFSFIKERIKTRIDKRLSRGLVEEIKGLLKKGYDWTDPGLNALAYKEFKGFFKGEADLAEVKKQWQSNEFSYAKAQLGWFKKDNDFIKVKKDKLDWEKRVHNQIKKWYH